MALIYPNIVPENDLRLPDALTVKHGPAHLLSRFVLAGDRYARERGLRLKLKYDFEELAWVNRQYCAQGSWYPIIGEFNPDHSELSPDNAFWVAGEDAQGEVAAVYAGHIYYWPDTNLEEQAATVFYGRNEGQPTLVTTPVARTINGVVMSCGCAWIRPDFRGRILSQLFARLAKAYGLSRWPIEWIIGYVTPSGFKKGLHNGYGAKHTTPGMGYPGTSFGELYLLYTSASEAIADLDDFLETELSPVPAEPSVSHSWETIFAQEVTKTSPELVFQGNSSRS